MANPVIRWIGKVLNLTDDAGVWSAILGTDTDSGESVTQESSLQSTTVWGCTRVIVEIMGQLPGSIFEKIGPGSTRTAEDHQVHFLLHHSPNRFMTPVEFKESMTLNLVLWGNGYALIGRSGNTVSSLTPLLAQNMNVEKKKNGDLLYMYWDGEQDITYEADEIMHLKGFGFNGLKGLSPISYCREAIGMSLKAEEFGARIFKQGALPGALIKVKHKLTDDQKKEYRKGVSALLEGVTRGGRVAVLDQADRWEYQQVSINPDELQFLESKRFQVEEITRIFRMPRHMIGDLERSTFSNIEMQDLELVKYTMMPYITRWEQTINKALFTPEEQMRFFAKFNVNALLRGDMKARAAFSSTMVQNGIFTRNEIRNLEDMDRSDQAGADDLTVQSNMIDLDQLAKVGDGTQEAA